MLQIWATRRGVATLIGTVIASALLVGCVGQINNTGAGYLTPEVDGFVAEIKFANGSEGSLAFHGPLNVLNVDNNRFAAYVVEEKAGEFHQTWYLDDHYRIVAHLGNCKHGFVGPCDQYDNWNWIRQGELNPMGIGFPDLIAVDEFKMTSGGNVTEVEWDFEQLENGMMELTVQMPDYWKPDGFQQKIYTYTPGRILPNSDQWRVLEYSETGPLQRADLLELPKPRPQESPWNGLMFDGENEDHFDIGFNHREIVEFAYPEFRETSEACVKDYYLRLFEHSGQNLLGVLPFDFGEDRIASAFVSVWADGKEKTSEVEVYRDRFDGNVRIETSPFSSGSIKESCSDMYRSPWPSMNLTEGIEFASSLDFSKEPGVVMFNHHIGDQRMVFQEPEAGWHSWRFGFKPGGDSGGMMTNYEIGFIPTESTLLRNALIHPDDISNFIRDDV